MRAAALSLSALLSAILLAAGSAPAPYASREALGEALFHDPNLSAGRSQSCASCHDPEIAFTDGREAVAGRAVSLGDDGHSLGERNAPSAAYAYLAPPFARREDGSYHGGLFWDGRADGLARQAAAPPLNPREMAMADEPAVAARLRENEGYRAAFAALYGPAVLDDPAAAFAGMTDAIATFEATAPFGAFDSKYDRWLRGEYRMTRQEELGRTLFFSSQFANCQLCHRLAAPMDRQEPFTNYEFHNIGVPANPALDQPPDRGLGAVLGDPGQDGKFRVPGLRNVAVTGPYMHNGVFADLRTVIAFYNKYNSRAPARQIDPETGRPWAAPEVADNIALDRLEQGPALDDRRIDALVAFLRTLTDRRYEPLLGQGD